MEEKDVRLKILINNSETQLIKNFFLIVWKKYTCFKENYFEFFLSNLIVLPWIRIRIKSGILGPDPNSMYLDPQHSLMLYFIRIKLTPWPLQVFCGKIPKDMYEDELIPLFEKWGKIWDLRLMMDPMSGLNRYVYIRPEKSYTTATGSKCCFLS